jgi:hypothetical protein
MWTATLKDNAEITEGSIGWWEFLTLYGSETVKLSLGNLEIEIPAGCMPVMFRSAEVDLVTGEPIPISQSIGFTDGEHETIATFENNKCIIKKIKAVHQ